MGLLCNPCASKRQCARQKSPERKSAYLEYQRQYWATNRAALKAYGKARYARVAADPVQALALKTKNDAWNAAHATEIRQRRKARYAANPSMYVAQSAEWARKNPDRAKANKANYSARKRGPARPPSNRSDDEKAHQANWRARKYGVTDGKITGVEWRGIVESFGHACAYCLRTDKMLTMDHVMALSRGGTHEASNIVPACNPCNASKRQRGILVMLNR